jgi:hypothetical protein
MRLRRGCGAAAAAILAAAGALQAQEDAALQERADRLAARAEALLGVRFRTRVAAARQDRDAFEDFLRERLGREFPEPRREALRSCWRLLGLVHDRFDLGAGLAALLRTQAGAHYDVETKRLYVLAAGLPDAVLDGIVFHELVHALQDQEHDLGRFHRGLIEAGNDDAVTAGRFLSEGEAAFWTQIFMLEAMGQPFRDTPAAARELAFGMARNYTTPDVVRHVQLQAARMGHAVPDLKAAAAQIRTTPPLLVRLLGDPYLRGLYAAYRIHERRGPAGFRELFRKEPELLSTRDFLFPDEALRRPRGMSLLRLSALPEALGEGWERTYEGTLGALTLHVLFEHERAEADAVALAWQGDRVEVWKKGEDLLLAGVVDFSADEAAALFARRLERLFRERWARGGPVRQEPGDGVRLASGTDGFWIQVRGRTAAFGRGRFPEDPAGLLSALWRSQVRSVEPEER